MVRLVIKPHRSSHQKPFDINAKVFERRQLSALLDILGVE
jgi:hypothetical protein